MNAIKILLCLSLLFSVVPVKANLNVQYHLDIQKVFKGEEEALAGQGNLFFIYNKKNENENLVASIIATHGETPSIYVGDLQTTSNLDIGGIEVVKIFELYYERILGNVKAAGGMLDLSNDFNVTGPASLFIHSSPGTSAELAAAGTFGTAFNPFTAPGAKILYRFSSNKSLKLAVIDAIPFHPDDAFGTQLSFKSDDGLFYISEFNFQEDDNLNLGLGFWGFTEIAGSGAYFQGDYKIGSFLHPFLKIGKAFENAQVFESNVVIGVTYSNWGLMFSRAEFSDSSDIEKSEDAYEYSYQIDRGPYLIQPNLQYIEHPALSSSNKEAWVIGLRLSINH